MLSFQINHHQFHLRSAAVIIHDEAVLLHRAEADDFWALPGGRVEADEDATSAVVREMMEEVSEPVECGQMLLVVENFFTYKDQRHHEIGLYFQVNLQNGSLLLDKTRSHLGQELGYMLEYRWFRLTDLENVDLRPRFLQGCLCNDLNKIQHIVNRETMPIA
jgi:ADP-ribose pyrophosphatase YjhB (NUDIX family)